MSLFSTDTIKLYAESVGLTTLSDDILQLLCHDVEYRVRELLQEAGKFMRHSNRMKLTTEDINHSLRLKNLEPIYGYDPSDIPIFKHLPQSNIFYMKDREVDFDSVLTSPLPKLPQPLRLSSHWLAIEGVQPQIPENPLFPVPATISSGISTLEGSSPIPSPQASPSISLSGSLTNLIAANEKPPQSSTVTVKHHLSKEHQMYFETVTNCLLSKDPAAMTTSLNSLRTDAGIQQLLPYLVQFVAEMVVKSLRHLDTLRLLLRALEAIISNPNFFLEPYLHQIMPTILTLIVGKRLSDTNQEDHWSLREEAAKLVPFLCKKFGDTYPEMQPRVLKTLVKALVGDDKSLASKFGAIVCLGGLGGEAIELFLIPNIKCCSGFADSLEKEKTEFVLLDAVGRLLASKIFDGGLDLKQTYAKVFDMFGEKLIPYLGRDLFIN